MLRVLLAKDLRRVWRNPLPALINIVLPLCITGLIGLAFGGRNENELEKIKFAVVDEDQSFLSKMLRGSMTQDEGGEHLAPVFVDRETALQQINDNKIGGALIIPTNFTRDYFKSRDVKLALIKNPAQSIQPAALEELAATTVAILNGLSRNFKAQFPDWHGAFEGDVDHRRISTIVERVGDRLDEIKKYVDPPLVSYEKETKVNTILSAREEAVEPKKEETRKTNGATLAPTDRSAAVSQTSRSVATDPAARGTAALHSSNTPSVATTVREKSLEASSPSKPKKTPSNMSKVFAWVLPGISAMFLLFLANNAMTDLYREMRFRTFERYQTLRANLLPFVLGKVVYAMAFLLICVAIMIGGGGLIFRIEWQQPLALGALAIGYAASCAAVMALFVALVPDERRANTLNSVVGMLLGFAGGCMFPARQLPPFIRDYLTPYLPSNWFVEAAHRMQDGNVVAWHWITLKLLIFSAVAIIIAVTIFQRRISGGLRA